MPRAARIKAKSRKRRRLLPRMPWQPVVTEQDILATAGVRKLGDAEFQRQFGHLPRDGEG